MSMSKLFVADFTDKTDEDGCSTTFKEFVGDYNTVEDAMTDAEFFLKEYYGLSDKIQFFVESKQKKCLDCISERKI